MKGKKWFIPILSMALLVLLSQNVGVTLCSFSDRETAAGNTLGAWTSTLWTQTTQADFNAGVLNDVDTSSVPGDVKTAAASDWYNSGWSYRKSNTIDHTKVGATLTDFPVLISLTSDAGLAAYAQDNGNDIVFTASNGVTKLDHEIEQFDGNTGKLVAWVRVPSVSSLSDTVIYLYYGNPSIGSQQNPAGVWNSNYKGVWHFNQAAGGSGAIKDSTSNANNGTDINSPTLGAAGKIGNAVSFDGINDYISVADSASLNLSADFTVELWFSPTQAFTANADYLQGLLDKGGYKLFLDKSDGKLKAAVADTSGVWLSPSSTISYNGAQEEITALAVYNGKLYAGQGTGTGDGDVLVFDGSTWATSYNGAQETIYSLAVYNGKLYAGQGNGTGDGDVLVFDGSAWTTSYNGAQERIESLAVYNGKLYAGQGNGAGDGDVLVFDGTSWTTSYDGPQEEFASLAVYNGKLYAGQGSGTGDGDVLVFDGTSWTTSYNGAQEAIYALAVYNGKLYAGQGWDTAGDGDVLVFDGTSWSISYNGSQKVISALAVYNGKLYAGQGWDAGAGDVLVFDDTSWTTGYNGVQETIYTLAVYNGRLYAGQGNDTGDGDVIELGSTDGYDGAQESITALAVYNGKLYAGQGTGTGDGDVLVFDGSTWTTSYNGAQERIESLAVYNGKLYAGQGTGTGDGDVLVFDGSAWTTSYNGAQERIRALAVYNGKLYAGQGNSTGDGDVLVFDGSTWTTGYDGAQEEFSSLAVYNGKLYAGQGSGAGDGDVLVFDGSTWTTSYDGAQETIESLAVYNGKLYAGQGWDTAGDGDVLVFDGTTWSISYNGSQKEIPALAVYNGKLYAGQGWDAGAGDVLVFDGSTWTTSYNGAQDAIYALAVYNGHLYAGQGQVTGDGDIYVLYAGSEVKSTTTSWSTSFHLLTATRSGTTFTIYLDGAQQAAVTVSTAVETNALNLLIGKLYGTRGTGVGEGLFKGIIDETRISSESMSAPWIATEYNNQNSPATFFSVGSEQGRCVSPGTLASQVLDTAVSGSRWDAICWVETLAASTNITLEVRASDTIFLKTDATPSWTAIGAFSPVSSGLTAGRYKQWRATLTTSNTVNTPILSEVRVYYH